ncbi:mitochondrial inner membrane protein Mitofilin [Xylariaceae sp. FL1272]|nr:mitochondrial inner membrane protein Mitofilin [Xylariaceae sp. FL1272]
MLRNSLRSVRGVGSSRAVRPAAAAARQWQAARANSIVQRRCFADNKKPTIDDSRPVKLPASETNTAAASEPRVPVVEAKVIDGTIDAQNVPLTPPEPEPVAAAPTPTEPPPPPPTPVKKKGFFRRLRNYVMALIFLGAITFGGGVWYSRINDNFHDFFTEYVPFGEQAVLYFEEMEFRKRYPRNVEGGPRVKDTGAQVKISPQSGASWRVADSGAPAGRQSSAMSDVAASKKAASEDKSVAEVKPAPRPEAPAPKPEEKVAAPPAEEPKPEKKRSRSRSRSNSRTKKSEPAFKEPEVDEPSRFPPPRPIDLLSVKDNTEPVVAALVHMLNDIILVVNADNSDERFSRTIYKAKNELATVGSQIREIKARIEKDAAGQVESKVKEFEMAANELVNRVETVMSAQESQWRAEFEEEMKRIQATYDSRLKTEIEREKQVNEEKLKNHLLEQAIELKRQFLKDVKAQVENEREGRLGKLEQLDSAVKELESLTTGWNNVVDSNLRTQQLHVAVEAVRANLEDQEVPRPFVRELVALKEIASDDAVVNAAIGSINPVAYQRGIPTSAQLMDRFRRVAFEVRKASLLPEDAGVASHASSYLLSKVMFQKQGLKDGDDVESILGRTQTYLEEGNLDAAAREMNGLQGWAKTLSRDWLGEVRKVLEVRQALDVIATEARLQSLRVA